MVATDLDGTLLDPTGDLTPRTRGALELARRAGAEVVFVTARPPRSVERLPLDGIAGTAICSNGALVFDTATREVVASHPLAPATAAKVAEVLGAALPGVGFAIETGWNVLFEPAYQRIVPTDVEFRRPFPDPESLWESDVPIAKLMVWSPEHDVEDMFDAALSAVDGQAEITHSGVGGMLEISAAGITKASTLAELCVERGVAAGEVVAFGDMPNDVAMLSFAGRGYAMANSHPSVLAAVPVTTRSNAEDGVAVVLEELFG